MNQVRQTSKTTYSSNISITSQTNICFPPTHKQQDPYATPQRSTSYQQNYCNRSVSVPKTLTIPELLKNYYTCYNTTLLDQAIYFLQCLNLEDLPDQEKTNLYTEIINACTNANTFTKISDRNHSLDKALLLYQDMKENNIPYSEQLCVTIIYACVEAAQVKKQIDHATQTDIKINRYYIDKALSIYQQVKDKKLLCEASYTIIQVCIKAGKQVNVSYLKKALLIFNQTDNDKLVHDARLYNAIIHAYVKAVTIDISYLDQALALFKEMDDKKLSRDIRLYNAIIQACVSACDNKVSYLDNAISFFKDIKDNSNFTTTQYMTIIHNILYACLRHEKFEQINLIVQIGTTNKIFKSDLGLSISNSTINLHKNNIYQCPNTPGCGLNSDMTTIVLLVVLPKLNIKDIEVITGNGSGVVKKVVEEFATKYGYTAQPHPTNSGRLIIRKPSQIITLEN